MCAARRGLSTGEALARFAGAGPKAMRHTRTPCRWPGSFAPATRSCRWVPAHHARAVFVLSRDPSTRCVPTVSGARIHQLRSRPHLAHRQRKHILEHHFRPEDPRASPRAINVRGTLRNFRATVLVTQKKRLLRTASHVDNDASRAVRASLAWPTCRRRATVVLRDENGRDDAEADRNPTASTCSCRAE